MTHRTRLLAAVVLGLFTLGTGGVHAAPSSITALATASTLNDTAQERISRYATYWSDELRRSREKPELLKRSRQRLIEPIRAPGVTQIFRTRYGEVVVERLKAVIGDDYPLSSVNALIVLSQVGTDKALRGLLDFCSPRDEERRHIRLTAARGCRDLLGSDRLGSVRPQEITQAARRLREAARLESDPLTLRHLLEAGLAADRESLTDDARRKVRGYLVEALTNTATRASEAPGASEAVALLGAAYPVLDDLRRVFFELQAGEQAALGAELGPCLRRVLDVATTHWTQGHASPKDRREFSLVIAHCETSLGTIDRLLRIGQSAPEATLRDAWDTDDLGRFADGLGRWDAVLSRRPY